MLHDPSRGAVEPLAGHPRFTKVEDLGQGNFGFVQKAIGNINIDGHIIPREVAIKFIARGSTINENVKREVLNHRQLTHDHVIQFREVILTPTHLGIVMDVAPGGTLRAHMKRQPGCRLPEDSARWFFQQLIIGMDYCHKMKICNRDIKPENTLLDEHGCVRISDFGFSKSEIFDSKPDSYCGTRAYMAPEVMLAACGDKYDGKQADIWSAGVMLYNMLTNSFPFVRPEDKKLPPAIVCNTMIGRIVAGQFPMPLNVSPACCDLLRKMLTVTPAQRITIRKHNGVPGIYDHPWFAAGLPAEALTMNDGPPLPPAGYQSHAEVKRLLEEACTGPAPTAPTAPAATHHDVDAMVAAYYAQPHSSEACPAVGGVSNNAAYYDSANGPLPFSYGHMGNDAPHSVALHAQQVAGHQQLGSAALGTRWQ